MSTRVKRRLAMGWAVVSGVLKTAFILSRDATQIPGKLVA